MSKSAQTTNETPRGSDETQHWDELRDAVETPASESPLPNQMPHAQNTQVLISVDALDDLQDDVFAHNPQAIGFYRENGCSTVIHAFTIANILHTAVCVAEASRFYRLAYDLHSKSPTEYPRAQNLLQVRLLCALKAGQALLEEECNALRRLNIPMANYIEAVRVAWRENNPHEALLVAGNSFEEFHTGEENDALYLSFARDAQYPFARDVSPTPVIPHNLYFYWDRNPPEEVARNFDFHRGLKGLQVKFFDQPEAEQWLYDVYGAEARGLFLKARHPAEAADIFRVHVIQALGGWWLDADIRLKDENTVRFMRERCEKNVIFLTNGNVVHNDFFGSVAQSSLLEECLLNIYRNHYEHQGLFIAYKSGPGVFNRALCRQIHRDLNKVVPMQPMALFDHHMFSNLIEEFDTPYKHTSIHWQAV